MNNSMFVSFAERVKAKSIAALDNHVIPAAKKLDHSVAVAVPVVQEKTGKMVGEAGVVLSGAAVKMASFADRLAKQARVGYAAVGASEKKVKVVMTEAQAAAWLAQQA